MGEPDAGAGDAGTDAGVVVRDLDVAVLKFKRDGTLDTSFGTGGKAVLDFGAASASARDSVYGMDVDAMGRVLLFGSTKGTGRSDVDRFVARLSPAGQLDTSFGVDGLHKLDLGLGTNESPRHGFVQGDGKIVTAGYSALRTGATLADGGLQTANSIVLLRLEPNGAPDQTFGTDGVVKENPFPPAMGGGLWGMCEAYAVVPQSGGRYVTLGYGRAAPSGTVDVVSLRFDGSGARDTTWAGANGGALVLDFIGADDRGRHASVLPDERVAFVGSATVLTGNIDAMVSLRKADGTADATFDGDGVRTFSFGRADEAFAASAVGPGALTLAAAGYRVGTANNDVENDDAVLALIPLSGGAPAEFAQPVPLSATTHDRFVGLAWDGMQVVAAGFVREGADTRFAVARFNLDGTRDTTFGTGGVVTLNVSEGGGTEETARWVKVLSDGSVLVAGVFEH
jgi:uncharacterized delta-60 repeat protein